MTALAEILRDLGHDLLGFDQANALASDDGSAAGDPTLPWKWLPSAQATTAMCVHSPAVKYDDRLLQRYVQNGVPTCSLHQALDAVFANDHQVCVAGTHGKSTTTAMLSWILDENQFAPGYFVGAKFLNSGRSGHSTPSASIFRASVPNTQRSAVIESCEFNRSFHQLSPSTIVLTGLERDHFDCFENERSEEEAFLRFLHRAGSEGTIVYNTNCKRSRGLVLQCECNCISFSVTSGDAHGSNADFQIFGVQESHSGIRIGVRFLDQNVSMSVPVFGRHNAANTIAAMAAAVSRGVSLDDAAQAMSRFPGIERRFQHRGTFHGMALVDDYAHHPTAIRATLQAARSRFPQRELRVCFEPHQLIRLAKLKNDFVDALALADMVYVLPVLAAREISSPAICHRESHNLVKSLRSLRTSAFFSPNLDHVVRTIDHSANPNAVLLTMGAGRTHLIHDKLTDRLRRYSVA